jgi:plasmid stability protein
VTVTVQGRADGLRREPDGTLVVEEDQVRSRAPGTSCGPNSYSVRRLADVLTSKRLDVRAARRDHRSMETTKRATIYFDPEIHRALRLKAAATERSVSELVNEAVGLALGEDAEDLEIFEQRRGGPLLSFDEVIKDLKRRGRI